jgi:hypothetical protein
LRKSDINISCGTKMTKKLCFLMLWERQITNKLHHIVAKKVCILHHLIFCIPIRSHLYVSFIKKNPTRCNNVSKFYYSKFIWNSTCFGRHTAHHQESKTALAAPSFLYMKGCWTCSWWTLWGAVCLTTSTNCTSKILPRINCQRLPVQF